MTDLKTAILLIVLVPVAVVICIPILLGSMLAVFVLTIPFVALGLDPDIEGYAMLIVGFGGGLVLCFLALVYLYRHLPERFRSILAEDSRDDPREAPPVLGVDPNADPSTLTRRVHALDARIGDPDDNADPAAAAGPLEHD